MLRTVRSLVLILTALLACAAPLHANGATWALIVGIDKYDSDDVAPLQCATADARSVAEVLQKSCGFGADHVILMTSDATGRDRPTSANILRWLEGLKSVVKPGDTFLFYFSGHGLSDNGESFLVTMDTSVMSSTLLRKTSLSTHEVETALKDIHATRIIQIVDACRNDPRAGRAAGDNVMDSTMARDLVLRRTETSQSEFTATLFACKEGQRSYEGHKGHGYFTWYLVKGLGGEAADSRGQVTLGSLVDYLEKKVAESVQLNENGHRQEPWVQINGAGAASWPMALTGKPSVGGSPSPAATAATGNYTISVSYPPPGFHASHADIRLTGVVVGPGSPSEVQVSVNGRVVTTAPGSVVTSAHGATLNLPIALEGGVNRIVLSTRDAAGRIGRTELTVFRDAGRGTTIVHPSPRPVVSPSPSPVVPSSPAVNPDPTPDTTLVRGDPTPSPASVSVVPSRPDGPGVDVTIRCSQANANLWVDRVLLANPPTTVRLAPGDHELRVTVDEGTAPYQRHFEVRAGEPMVLDVELSRSATGLYKEAVQAWQAGDTTRAATLFEASTKAAGKHPAEVLFYQALIAYRANRLDEAEKAMLGFLQVHDESSTGHYMLGMIRQKLNKPLATTAYKASALRLFRDGRALLAGTGPITAALVTKLQKSSGLRARLQLGYALEQRGALNEARDIYRLWCENVFDRYKIKLDVPLPESVTLPPD